MRVVFVLMLLSLCYRASCQEDKGIHINHSKDSKPKDRIALVIGNGRYSGEARLRNPGNDAAKMAAALSKVGFDTIVADDLGKKSMDSLIDAFGSIINEYKVALFYYSGHGAEVAGENYLFPIDAHPAGESDAQYQCYNVNEIVGKMNDAGTATKIILLDACRNNPWQKGWHKSTAPGGLATMKVPDGIFFGFATSPESTADDGNQNNSPFVIALTEHIDDCNYSINDIFTEVTRDVKKMTDRRQVPYSGGNLDDMFYFCQNIARFNSIPSAPATPRTVVADNAPVSAVKPNVVVAKPGAPSTTAALARMDNPVLSSADMARAITDSISVNRIKEMLYRVKFGKGVRDVAAFEYGEGRRNDFNDSLSIAGECTNDTITYLWRFSNQTVLKVAIQDFLTVADVINDIQPNSYLVYFFQDKKLVSICLRLRYRDKSILPRLFNLFKIDPTGISDRFIHCNSDYGAVIEDWTTYKQVNIYLFNSVHKSFCDSNWWYDH